MKKRKFNKYKDGVILFGDYIESYNEDGNANIEKEFTQRGKLLFSYKTIREQDKLKFAYTGLKISIKVEVPYYKGINASDTINLNDELYSILHIDLDKTKTSMYIYLTNLIDELNRHIEIYRQYRKSPLENKTIEVYRIVWGKVEEISDSKVVDDAIKRVNQRKKVIIRYLKNLDPNVNKNSNNEFLIKYKENYYNINQTINVNDDDKLLELSLERK